MYPYSLLDSFKNKIYNICHITILEEVITKGRACRFTHSVDAETKALVSASYGANEINTSCENCSAIKLVLILLPEREGRMRSISLEAFIYFKLVRKESRGVHTD